MRAPRTALAVAAAVLVATALPALAQESADVEVVDSAFEPAEITIDAGGTVTWTQTGSLPHSVTADDGSFDSHPACTGAGAGCMQNGDTFSETFSEPGEYAYYCKVHGAPGGVGMAGTVVVAAAQEEPTEEPTEEETEEPADDGEEATVTGSITVSDQTGDGSSVTVDSVTIEGSDGWIAVHIDQDGGPGPVIGHGFVEEGTTTDLVVAFDEPRAEDTTVWPMLHVDAGEAGTYEFPGPDGPVTADGEVVMAPLDLTVSADAADDGLPATGGPLTVLLVAAALLVLLGGFTVSRSRAG